MTTRTTPRKAAPDRDTPPPPGPYTREGVAALSLKQLRAACKARRVRGYGRASREILEAKLLGWQETQDRRTAEGRTPVYTATCFPTLADFEAVPERGTPCAAATGWLDRARTAARAALTHAYVARVEGSDGYVEVMRRDRDPGAFLRRIGPLLYGEKGWPTAMARDMGYALRHLRYWQTGDRLPPADFRRRVEAVARHRLAEIEAQADRLRRLLAEGDAHEG